MRDIIIDTEAMLRFDAAVDSMLDVNSGLTGFVLAHGQAGRGKTVASHRYHLNRGGAYVRVWENWSQSAFLQRLLFEVRGQNGDMPRHQGNRCKEMVVQILLKNRIPIVIDEADRLRIERIEDLRDIGEATGAPIILVAEEGIFGLLSERRRIWSRVVHEVEFTAINAAEVAIYAMKAAGLDISAELCGIISQKAEGDFRIVRNMMLLVEQASKAAETVKISAEILETALASRTWRRK